MDPLPAHSGGRKTAYRYADIGLQFAASIGVFAFLGNWADSNWGTRPWLLILGVFLGFGLGLWSMIIKIGKLPSAAKTETQGTHTSKIKVERKRHKSPSPPQDYSPEP